MIFKNLLRNCVFLNSKQILNVIVRMLPRKLLTFCLALPLHNSVHNYEYFFYAFQCFERERKLNWTFVLRIRSLHSHWMFHFCFVLDETIPVMGGWGGLSVTQRTKTLNDVYLFLLWKLFVCFKMNLKPSYLGTYIRVYRNWREFLRGNVWI